jgi:hypothetical protein
VSASISTTWLDRLVSYKEPRGILRFVDEQFSVQLDSWQERALSLFESPLPEHRRLSLQACVGPGKSAVLAWCGLWFISCQGSSREHPKGLVTSITGDNLRDNLWAEYAKWRGQSEYLKTAFTWTSTRLFATHHPETWFIGTRSWPKTSNADELGKTFSGLHSAYVMAQVDESGAIPPGVARAADQALARCIFGKLLQAGNPISLDGMLYAAASLLRHLWTIIKVTGDPDDAKAWVHSPRVGDGPLKWAREQIATYGRDNPWVASYILGDFPKAAVNALLSVEDIEQAMARRYRPDVYDWQQKRIGADIARFGDDRNVFFPRQGLRAFKPLVIRNARTTQLAARLAEASLTWQGNDPEPVQLFVDDTGHWGHGVIDGLHDGGYPVFPVIYSDRSADPRYENVRAQIHFAAAEWVKNGGMLPEVPELVAEATTPTYSFKNGRMIVEPKEFVKKRLGRSPDLWDALAETFFLPDQPAGMVKRINARHRVRTMDTAELEQSNTGQADIEFDPFA